MKNPCDKITVALSLTDQSFKATKSMGIFNVSTGLAKGLMHCPEITELHLLGNEECAAAFAGAPSHVRLHLADQPVPRRFGRLWWDQAGLPAALRRLAPDWAILPKGFPPFFPRLRRTRLACYVHDVIWEYYAAHAGQAGSPFPWHELLYFRTLGRRALRISDLILTSTQFNAARFRAHVPQARTAVVGIGFDTPAATPAPLPSGKTDILFYASPYPHKLTALGVQRLESWLAQRADASRLRIHIIGNLPQGTCPAHPAWVRHGRLPQQELQQLITRDCRVCIYFTAYEGYGMPPVESLRMGVPCLASDIPPIRENIPARYLFPNEDEAAFIRCLNATYDTPEKPDCPPFPDWRTVAQRCVRAMLARDSACQINPIVHN